MTKKCSQTLNFDSGSSDDESDNSRNEYQPAKRRKLLDWNFVKNFSTKQAAHVDSCSAKCRIILLSNNTSVIVEKTTDEHDHVPIPKTGIDAGTKIEIQKLLKSGVTQPKLIFRSLLELGVDVPTKTKLTNFLATRRKKEGPTILSIGVLEAECARLSEVPVDNDESYIVNCEFDYDSKWFGLLISTPRLLQLLLRTLALHADATYKLNWIFWIFWIGFFGLEDCDAAKLLWFKKYEKLTLSFLYISKRNTCSNGKGG
ncbi:hypothetical protein Fcan01_28366 [Folsomia candida]|uniref:Uncharacterized protein n=1 Tax=Folsomia candida TaxID=158441 RepID=A0A226CWG9_FOLCA|nr:hypothetical protein Fcan01_28366 [Folsomia candida]